MMRHFSSATRAVTIDECPTCGGIWLDRGELEQMRAEHRLTPAERVRAAQRALAEIAIDDGMADDRREIRDSIKYDTSRSRMASVCLVAFYLLVVGASAGRPSFVLRLAFLMMTRTFATGVRLSTVAGFCLVPTACIWFPETLGSLVGGRITSTSPRSFVWGLGWLLLLLPALFAAFFYVAGVDHSPFE